MKITLTVVIFGCLLLAAVSATLGAEQVVIGAYDLHKAASEDRKSAEALYLGQTIQVKGIVVAKGMSIYFTPTVTLSNSEGGEEYIICVLPRLDVGKLSDFRIGQSVIMSGRVNTLGQRVIVKESKVVQ